MMSRPGVGLSRPQARRRVLWWVASQRVQAETEVGRSLRIMAGLTCKGGSGLLGLVGSLLGLFVSLYRALHSRKGTPNNAVLGMGRCGGAHELNPTAAPSPDVSGQPLCWALLPVSARSWAPAPA